MGLKAGSPHATAVAQYVDKIFQETAPPISIPVSLIQCCFSVFKSNSEDKHHSLFRFDEWLNATSQRDPEVALAATEIYLAYAGHARPYFYDQYFYDHENQLAQLVNQLFAEAEEQEESDHGAMLKRVVSLQDSLLSLGVKSINDFLKKAERP